MFASDIRLRRVGVPTTLEIEKLLPHGFIGMINLLPDAWKLSEHAAQFLVSVFEDQEQAGCRK